VSAFRALVRHVGLWGAILLGLFVAMAVIILYATPGPWHTATGNGQAAKPSAPATSDLAVFVLGSRSPSRCVGVVWVHTDPAVPSLSTIVVPALALGFLPEGGYEAITRIVDEAGPAAGAAALGLMTGTKMSGWVTVGQGALQVAFPDAFPTISTRDAVLRLRQSLAAWRGDGPARTQLAGQKAFVDMALTQSDFSSLNVVAFANFVLASSGVRSNIDLQTAASVAATLRDMGKSSVGTAAIPATVASTGASSTWRLDGASVAAITQSLALGTAPPAYGPQVKTIAGSASVVAVIEPMGSLQRPFLASLEQQLHAASGLNVAVKAVVATPGSDVAAQLATTLGAGRPQAVLVALGWGASRSAADIRQELADVIAVLSASAQPAVIAAPPGGDSASGVVGEVLAAAKKSGLPLSPAAPPLTHTLAQARPAAAAAAWAGAAALTLVRACEPALFSPTLAATRLGVGYYTRVHTQVAVAGAGAVQTAAIERLRACGWAAVALPTSTWSPASGGVAVYCQSDALTLARAVAGDMSQAAVRVIVDPAAPAAVTVVPE
jgi:hypothetical protein